MSLLRKLFIRGASGNEAEVNASNELLVNTGLTQPLTDTELRATPIETQITDGAGTVNTKQLGTAVTTSDVGLVTNSVIHGQTTGGGGGYVDVKVEPSGKLLTFDENNQPEVMDDYAPNQTTVTGAKQALQVDPTGQLAIRGTVLTDETSFRDDFNDPLLTDWNINGTVTQADSKVLIDVANSVDSSYIYIDADYLPASITFRAKQDNLHADLVTLLGWVDNEITPTKGVYFKIENSTITCRSFTLDDSFNEDLSIVEIPLNGILTDWNNFTVSLESSAVRYLINDIEVATHKTHIPNPYDVLKTYAKLENLGTAPATTLSIDYVFFQNINQVEITNNFKPLPVELSGKDVNGLVKTINVDQYGAIPVNFPNITLDSGGRTRVGQITTLFDGKVLNEDRVVLFDNQGTGTGTFSNNSYLLSVTSGQYRIRQEKFYNAYFSGKSQLIETTFDTFQAEANVTKRVGYFSSNAVAPFASNYDGFYLESSDKIYLVVANNGTEILRKPIEEWDNYAVIKDYDWSLFTVFAFDFLWLGGAGLRVFLKYGNTFLLVHTYVHAGSATGAMFKSPNQPVRYEIRSTTGTGSFKYMCSMVGTEGSTNEAGLVSAIPPFATAITLASATPTYAIRAIRKNVTLRDIAVAIIDCNIFTGSNSDQILWSLQLNPTLSAPLTYTSISGSSVQFANGNGTINVTSSGRILASGFQSLNQVLQAGNLKDSYLSYLGSTLNNTMDEIVLCAQVLAGAPVSCYGSISFKEF